MGSNQDENKVLGNDDNEQSFTANMNATESYYWDDFTFPSPYLDRFADTATRYFWYDDQGEPLLPPTYTQERKDLEDRVTQALYKELQGVLHGVDPSETITINIHNDKNETPQVYCNELVESRKNIELKKRKSESTEQRENKKKAARKKDSVPKKNTTITMGPIKETRLLGWIETTSKRKKEGKRDKNYYHIETKVRCRSVAEVLRYVQETPEQNSEDLKNIRGSTYLKRIERGPYNKKPLTITDGGKNDKIDEALAGPSSELIAITENNAELINETHVQPEEDQVQSIVDFELIPVHVL